MLKTTYPKDSRQLQHVAGGFWAVILTPSCAGEALARRDPVRSRVADEVCALNRWYGAGPACDSLDHRAGACYLPRSLHTMNFVMPLAFTSLSVPPSAFERALHSFNQVFHRFGAKQMYFVH